MQNELLNVMFYEMHLLLHSIEQVTKTIDVNDPAGAELAEALNKDLKDAVNKIIKLQPNFN